MMELSSLIPSPVSALSLPFGLKVALSLGILLVIGVTAYCLLRARHEIRGLGTAWRRVISRATAGMGSSPGGLGLAYAAIEALKAYSPGGIPRLGEVGVDLRVVGFAAVAAITTALVAGLAPSLRKVEPAAGIHRRQDLRGASGL